MKLTGAVLGVMVLGFLAAGCSKEFKEFSPDGKFKVMMPGTPTENTQFASGAAGGPGAFVKMWVTEVSGGAYMVSAADFPNTGGADVESLLDGGVNGAMANSGGTLGSQSKVTLAGKYPGRDFQGTIPSKDAALHARMYIVNGRLYQLLVLGKKSFVDSPDTAKFLDSFKLVE